MNNMQILVASLLSLFFLIHYAILFKYKVVRFLIARIERKNRHIKEILDIHSYHVSNYELRISQYIREIKGFKEQVSKLKETNP